MACMTLREAMLHAGERESLDGWPRCYYWKAVWWRLHARESANPAEALRYSRNQMALYHDIRFRRDHYLRKPKDVTDWVWSGLGEEEAGKKEETRQKVWRSDAEAIEITGFRGITNQQGANRALKDPKCDIF